MPTYDYECTQCDHKFEAFQNITAAPLRKCPKCGRKSLRRLIGGGAGIIFKGSGFYATDYRGGSSGGSRPRNSKSSSDKSETKSGDGSSPASADSAGVRRRSHPKRV